MSGPPLPPPRWGPLTPQRWPQDENRVPSTPGLRMPPVSQANAQRSIRESFTMAGTFLIPGTVAVGNVFPLYLPTDPDGDFWCDQIMMMAFVTAGAFPQNTRPPVSTIYIGDARTGNALTYPSEIPTNFLTEIHLFSDDPGHVAASSPNPDGFRATATLPQPFCFTRAGGIRLNLTALARTGQSLDYTVDIGFSGWKEYEAASA